MIEIRSWVLISSSTFCGIMADKHINYTHNWGIVATSGSFLLS